ncbi:hypothetical protein BKA70DRAFT_1418466 [Coprinopsis sp. MPI-PUGE-AT-0042]|nr:hypothetical protein BKA70DRAFT_1418466 [Coprinopsis sp. MPI-PUGE-AT-0042]
MNALKIHTTNLIHSLINPSTTLLLRRYYCVETLCAPCGVVEAWSLFAKSESPTNIMKFLESVYPNPADRPSYLCIDKACILLKTVANHFRSWISTTRFIVDSYHHRNHSKTDELCQKWCNPAPDDGSAPNLVIKVKDNLLECTEPKGTEVQQ